MMKHFLSFALMTSALASASSLVQYHDDAKLGRILTDASGVTLYIFTRDTENTSNCYDQCTVNWPPLLVSHGSQLMGTFKSRLCVWSRPDGALQVTIGGKPVSYWVKDQKAGDTTGHGVGNAWWVIQEEAAQ